MMHAMMQSIPLVAKFTQNTEKFYELVENRTVCIVVSIFDFTGPLKRGTYQIYSNLLKNVARHHLQRVFWVMVEDEHYPMLEKTYGQETSLEEFKIGMDDAAWQ
ncbi:unnamed protein product [Protopolystoma xenopodis]|uniref:Uncharacterized protein n=1 Tax=Protopolystoma xenopodis TaxID=117903 RepID=A0A448WNV5_9PLAT|nr:unnamed protein product [Protopolystoma xenopodis]